MDLEPAERNPVELRRTAFILIGIMLVGAFFVLQAYKKHETNSNPDRPPLSSKISRNLAAKNQRDEFASLSDLEGKVWFAAPFCVSQLDENKHAIAMMKELDERYKDRDDVHFVLISIDGVDHGVTAKELKQAAGELQIDGSRWTLLVSHDSGKLRGYIKDQLRLGLVTERSADEIDAEHGKWKFPSEIALIDRGLHVRQRYDFRETHEAEILAQKNIQENPKLKNEKNIDFYLRATARLKSTLFKNADYVLSETETGK